jgi:hypothetical protein
MCKLNHPAVCRRVRTALLVLLISSAWAPSALAQFRPPSEAAVGENYNIEGVVSWWSAEPSLIVASTSIGIPGTDVNLVSDLGITARRLREFRLVLRPGRKHKFRVHYLPIVYGCAPGATDTSRCVDSVVQREFVFNGQRYRIGLPVSTYANLTTYRFGYEYDFVYLSRGYAGVLLDVKYTDVDVRLDSPIGSEFTQQVAPIPTLGFTGRGYVVPNVAIGGEFSFFKVPENLSEDFGGKYFDYDIYGTANFTRNVGVQVGYRNVEVEYTADLDRGNLEFRGWYFAGVLRY